MNEFSAAGLSNTEAKCYTTLVNFHDISPSELAKIVNETRTNCYKILDKLVSMKLAEKFEKDKKFHYRASNPARLLELARENRNSLQAAEAKLEATTSTLRKTFFLTNEQPGINFFQGHKEIKKIFDDQVKVGQPIHFMNTIAGIDFYGYESMHNLRMKTVNAGIERYALTPDTELITKDYVESDKLFHLHRTWLKDTDYTAPVEWGAYGDKVYIISFGTEAIGFTIESRQIADAFRQIFLLVRRGQRLLPNYDQLPLKAKQPTTRKRADLHTKDALLHP